MRKKKVHSVTVYEEHGKPNKDQYDNYSSAIVFEDNTQGIYAHKELPNTLFIPGQEAEFDFEQKGNYIRLKKPKAAGGYGGGPGRGWVPKSPGEVKRDLVYKSLESTIKLIVAGTVVFDKLADTLAIIQGAVNDEVDKIID